MTGQGIFGATLGEGMGKRQPQIILKTDDGKVVLELGLEGKFAAKSTGGDQNRVFLEGDKPRDRGQRPPLGADAPTRQTHCAEAGAALLPRRRVTAQQRPGTALRCAVTSGVEAGNGVADEEARAPRRRGPNRSISPPGSPSGQSEQSRA